MKPSIFIEIKGKERTEEANWLDAKKRGRDNPLHYMTINNLKWKITGWNARNKMSDQEYLADMVRGPRDYRIEFEIEQRKRIGGQYEKTREGYKIPHEFARGILAPRIQFFIIDFKEEQSNNTNLKELSNTPLVILRILFAPVESDRRYKQIRGLS